MKRRNFLQAGAWGSLVTSLALTGCNSNEKTENKNGPANPDPFPLEEFTVEQLQQEMSNG